jgi:hypothetical protein
VVDVGNDSDVTKVAADGALRRRGHFRHTVLLFRGLRGFLGLRVVARMQLASATRMRVGTLFYDPAR